VLVAFLTTRSPEESAVHTAAFLRGLEETGYVDRRNMAIEYRWARGQYERLPTLAAELAGLRPAVIVAGGDPSALAAKVATKNIPIVFIIGDDPVRLGLVASLNRPAGNATGVSLITSALGAKRLELLCELVPDAGIIGLLVNPSNPNAEAHALEVQTAAQVLGRRLIVLRASLETEFESNFATLRKEEGRALVVENDPFFDTRRDQLVALAAGRALPVIYHISEFPKAGGLMSYGPSLIDGYHQLGIKTGRVLNGANPGDDPVVRPTRFELVINLKAVKALGLDVPDKLLVAADEVIE
jgi:putative ABC transport system substrate-binding protein